MFNCILFHCMKVIRPAKCQITQINWTAIDFFTIKYTIICWYNWLYTSQNFWPANTNATYSNLILKTKLTYPWQLQPFYTKRGCGEACKYGIPRNWRVEHRSGYQKSFWGPCWAMCCRKSGPALSISSSWKYIAGRRGLITI